MSVEIKIVHNKNLNRFETEIEGEYAYIDYRFNEGEIVLVHTFTPESARGKGISSALAKFVIQYIVEQNLKTEVHCPFIKAYIKTHPEYESQIEIRYRT